MDRCKRCCFRSQDEWVKRITGLAGTVVLWMSIGSVLTASINREQCATGASVVPMLLLPTGIMGIFSSAFTWVYITFLWNDDAHDAMKFFTYVTGIVTGILQFVTFGFAASRFSDPECVDPFMGYSFGAPFFLGLLFTFIIILNCVHRSRNSKISQNPT